MGTRDPRIDAYIDRSAPFARPVLQHLREVVHAGCPEAEETLKWGMPYFMYKGMLCGMAAFKRHCTFGFWKGSQVVGSPEVPVERAMGQFGAITGLADLPPKKTLIAYVRKAAKLNDEGVTAGKAAGRVPKKPLPMPDQLAAALGRSRRASAAFEAFSPSQRREYIEWIADAKTDATRERRVATAVEWIEEGKSRNWKYQR